MDRLDHEDVVALCREHGAPCVSLFLSTQRKEVDAQGDQIRFKNMLRAAEERLLARPMRMPEVQELLEPAQRLLRDTTFWSQLGGGVAVFASPGRFRSWRMRPAVQELLVVGERPYLKPLLRENGSRSYFLLALSQQRVVLYKGDRHQLEEVDVPELPRDMRSALNPDQPETWDVQEIERYFRLVDDALHEVLRGETRPLVLAGVEYLHPVFHRVSRYPHLADEGVRGNPDALSAKTLHERSWPVAEWILARARRDALRRYQDLAGAAPGKATADPAEIVRAARYGRVETLFVALGTRCWGRFDDRSGEVHVASASAPAPGPADEDLGDLAACETFLHGGEVHVLDDPELPGDGMAAVMRF